MYEIIENWTEISITYLNNSENEPEPRKLGNRKPTFVKKAMERSYGRLCPLCGVKMSNVSGKVGDLATWEHLLDLSIGGKNTEGNSAIICSACNTASGIVMQTYLKCEDFPPGSREWKDKFISNNLNIIKLQRYIAWKFNSIWFGNIDIDPLLGKIWKSRRFGKLGENTELSDIKTPILQTSKVLLPDTKIPTYAKIKNKLFSLIRFGRGDKDTAKNAPVESNSADNLKEIIIQVIGKEEINSALLGQKIIKYQKKNGWNETGKKAFNIRFGLPKNQTYKATISNELSSDIEILSENGHYPIYKRKNR